MHFHQVKAGSHANLMKKIVFSETHPTLLDPMENLIQVYIVQEQFEKITSSDLDRTIDQDQLHDLDLLDQDQ